MLVPVPLYKIKNELSKEFSSAQTAKHGRTVFLCCRVQCHPQSSAVRPQLILLHDSDTTLRLISVILKVSL